MLMGCVASDAVVDVLVHRPFVFTAQILHCAHWANCLVFPGRAGQTWFVMSPVVNC